MNTWSIKLNPEELFCPSCHQKLERYGFSAKNDFFSPERHKFFDCNSLTCDFSNDYRYHLYFRDDHLFSIEINMDQYLVSFGKIDLDKYGVSITGFLKTLYQIEGYLPITIFSSKEEIISAAQKVIKMKAFT
jgi:hypothetical protein